MQKKTAYPLLEQKGQRAKILIALARGTENITSITKALGYKNKKSSSITKYIQKLQEKDLLNEESKEVPELKKFYVKRRCLILKFDKFFIERAYELLEIKFSDKEKLLLKKFLEELSYNKDREEFVHYCIVKFDGLIFPFLLNLILSALLNGYRFFDKKENQLIIKLISLSFLFEYTPFFREESSSLHDLYEKQQNNSRLENLAESLAFNSMKKRVKIDSGLKKELRKFESAMDRRYYDEVVIKDMRQLKKIINP